MTHDGGIVFVPHTHWDREWYEPFQVFRLRLVEVLGDVIERAERHPDFRFTIDGQMAAVEDYLEVRPHERTRIAELVRAGRLAVGPWHILLDEFLCSGETIVRNLELGWRLAESLGGAMPVGYLPDMFGHCAQMPQILARAGISHACLWRGVPGRIDTHAFRWTAPDGSSVRVEYLWGGYGNGLDLFAFPDRLADAVAGYRAETRDRYGDDPVLAMLGSDHSSPRPDLLPLVRSNGLRLATLAEYVSRYTAEDPSLPEVTGELRSHARGNILPGVLSIRVGLKQAMAVAEGVLREAEAVSGQWSPKSFDRYLDMAWRKVVECTAHDSVTGCGVDETAGQVAARLAEAAQMGRAVRDAVLRDLSGGVAADEFLVANTLPWARTAVCELDVPGDDRYLMAEEKLASDEYELLLRRIHGRELFGQLIERFRVEPGEVTFELARTPATESFDKEALHSELEHAAASDPGVWTVRTYAQRRRTELVAVDLPGSGLVVARRGESADVGSVRSTPATLDNELVRVEVETDGTLTISAPDGTVLRGVGRLVDGGDRGDSYNYGPPAADTLVDQPVHVSTALVAADPLRGIVRVVREYNWPAALSEDPDSRAGETVRVPVTMDVSLRAGEPYVRLELEFVNQVADHRLRLHVPLPEPVTSSSASGQFAVTSRGLESEGGWGEFPLPTYPAESFVSAGAATVLVEHVTEYELVEDGAELALTLLRAVGWMSVNVHPHRDEPAGSQLAVPGAQYLGRTVRTRLAVLPSLDGWDAVQAPRRAAELRHEPLVTPGTASGGGGAAGPKTGIEVSGSGVDVPSVRRRGESVEVRLVAMAGEATEAVVTGEFTTATRTDLLGRVIAELPCRAGRLTVDLAPWEIATIRLSR